MWYLYLVFMIFLSYSMHINKVRSYPPPMNQNKTLTGKKNSFNNSALACHKKVLINF